MSPRHLCCARRPRSRLLALVAATASLLSLSCFEQPITEKLEIRFLPGNAALVKVSVALLDPDSLKGNPAARGRVEAERADLLEGQDAWSRRFAALGPDKESITWDKAKGILARVTRQAATDDMEALKAFFADTMIRADCTVREEETEFVLIPEPGSRGTRSQQEDVERMLGAWSTALARYFTAAQALYGYLDEHPDRAQTCLGDLLRDLLKEEARDQLDKPSEPETALLDPVKQAMQEVLEIFSVPEDSAYSPEELSRLVYDPFPAPLTVGVPGPVLEVEGFESHGDGVLKVPGGSLWTAFRTLDGKWLSPDPAVATYEHLGDGKSPLDLEEFLGRPRRASRVSAAEVREAIEEHLASAPAYRVRWSTKNLPQPKAPVPAWDPFKP